MKVLAEEKICRKPAEFGLTHFLVDRTLLSLQRTNVMWEGLPPNSLEAPSRLLQRCFTSDSTAKKSKTS